MVPLRYNVRSLMVRKLTTFATAFGIALVVFVFAAALMLTEGVNAAMVSSARKDTCIVLRKGSDAELASSLTTDQINLLRGNSAVASGAPGGGVIPEVVLVMTPALADGSGVSNVAVRAMPAEGYAFHSEFHITQGRAPTPGTNEVVVGKGINGRFKNIEVGKSFEMRRNRPLVVVGEFEAGGSSYEAEVWGDLEAIAAAAGRKSAASSARVRLTSPSAFDGYRAAIESDKRLNLKVMREDEYYEKQAGGTKAFLGFIGILFAVLFSFAAMIGAAITMNGAVAHRTKEIGTLRALGFSRFSILTSFLFEAILLCGIGAIIGLVFVQVMSLFTFRTMNFQTFSEIAIHFKTSPSVIATALIFSMFMGLLGGLVPAIRAARISPVEAMRG
jgi:putative ABC transport system permease protein